MFPKKLLDKFEDKDKAIILSVVEKGGFIYNSYGEACLSKDDEDNEDYSSYCSSQELEQSIEELMNMRSELDAQSCFNC